jgi:hypothetical protein
MTPDFVIFELANAPRESVYLILASSEKGFYRFH